MAPDAHQQQLQFLPRSRLRFSGSYLGAFADPLFRLSLNYIIPATLITAAFFIFVIGKGLRAQLLPVKVGAETLLGKTVTALTPIDSRGGRVFVEGEYWNAVSDTPLEKGEVAQIAGVQGLTVKLKTKGK